MAKKKLDDSEQYMLFEEDYLFRTYGSITHSPDIALTELVANAWDAGASKVKINIPDEKGELLTIEDDGTGMLPEEFKSRWMILGYNRVKHQGIMAEFPRDRSDWRRRAYGRNGIGRHGLLCFADEYIVESWQNGNGGRFTIKATSGRNPFTLISKEMFKKKGHGTKLSVRVERHLSNDEYIREVLSARFLSDPQFEVIINGYSTPLSELPGLIDIHSIVVNEKIKIEMFSFDSTRTARTKHRHGIAFWIGGRLVGEPSWNLGESMIFDGRRSQAKRLTIVVKSDDLFDEVLPDWSAFKKSETVSLLYEKVSEYVQGIIKQVLTEQIDETKETAIRANKDILKELDGIERFEVSEFVDAVVDRNPTLSPDALSAAVRGIAELEKKRSGKELLEKILNMSDEDIAGLNNILDEWSIRDCKIVLDEIGKRLRIIEALEKLVGDPKVDELHTIHPLVTQARWLFGPEYESPQYVSNVSIKRAVQEVFGNRISKTQFDNPKKRPDLVFLADSTLSVVATEDFDHNSDLAQTKRVLIVELKKGGSSIGRDEMDQASGYVEDILGCGFIGGKPFVNAYVVGYKVKDSIQKVRKVGDNPELGRIEACDFGQLTRTANLRLCRLRDVVSDRYSYSGDNMVDRVMQEIEESELFSVTDE